MFCADDCTKGALDIFSITHYLWLELALFLAEN
jgi:hypothetical protein